MLARRPMGFLGASRARRSLTICLSGLQTGGCRTKPVCAASSWADQLTDQWNAYASLIIERLQGFQPGTAARELTSRNTFDPADMKRQRTLSS